MTDPTMNAQQPMLAMSIQHDRQHEGFCSFSPLLGLQIEVRQYQKDEIAIKP